MTEQPPAIAPHDLLRDEFLDPMNITEAELAEGTGLPIHSIHEILAGRQGITVPVDEKLCEFLGLSPGYWLRAAAISDH